jgi:hypothetical protein
VIVTVRLNITMDADLYQRLKRELPAKRISRFISDAVRAYLHRWRVEVLATGRWLLW